MRHGESEANMKNYWTGWLDMPLTAKGKQQAYAAGKLMKERQLSVDFCGTSFLTRTIQTANRVLSALDQLAIPVEHTWRLNERHYGALVGVNKEEMVARYGNEQVQAWRRGYRVALPKGSNDYLDRRYQFLDAKDLPQAESLADCAARVLPYYHDVVVPHLLAGENVLLVAHGNSLRGLIKYLEDLPDEEVKNIMVPNATPVVYELAPDLQILGKEILK